MKIKRIRIFGYSWLTFSDSFSNWQEFYQDKDSPGDTTNMSVKAPTIGFRISYEYRKKIRIYGYSWITFLSLRSTELKLTKMNNPRQTTHVNIKAANTGFRMVYKNA